MARKLDDIFNECYERIRSGESLESCLRSYPHYRAQLEPLLRTTFDIGRRISYIHPRPEFKHWAQVRLESAQRYPRQPARVEAPAASVWWRHGWAVAVSAGIILLLTTGSTMAASSQALPTEPLYPVKLATEQVRVALAVSDAQKAQIETELVNTRVQELEAMADAGKTEEVVKAAERYDEQYEKASLAITEAEGTEFPVVTIPPEETPTTTTPPVVTTPPTTTTPPVETTPPTVTTAAENTTASEPTTPTETTTTTPTETTTSTETTTPSGTTTTTATTTPSTTTTPDNSKAARAQKLKDALNKSKNKGLSALEVAKNKASADNKASVQTAIDNWKKKHGAGGTSSQSDNVTGAQGTGGTSSTTVHSDNTSPTSPWHRTRR
jgi:hypothetical protein